MRRLLTALAMLFAAPGTAMACSCLPMPQDAAERRALAEDVARGAVALVDVDVRAGYNVRTRRGELMRVRRTLAGRAPREFRLARRGPPSSAACGVEYPTGSRAMVLLYRADRPIVQRQRQFRDNSLCVSMLLHNTEFRRLLIAAMGRSSSSDAAPVGPSASPCTGQA